MAVQITLSWSEVMDAAYAGCRRQVQALAKGREDYHGFADAGWDAHVQGAAAEKAIAKHFGVYWEPVADRPRTLPGDVGPMEVRSTERANGCLILHRGDADDRVFYLVTGTLPTLTIAGSIRGREGKQQRFWNDPSKKGRPAFFVPQNELDPVEPHA